MNGKRSLWLFMILILTPLLGVLMVEIPFVVRTLLIKSFLYCPQPYLRCILTGQANGNVALGLLLTVSTNLLGIISMPLMLLLTFRIMVSANVVIDVGVLLLGMFVCAFHF